MRQSNKNLKLSLLAVFLLALAAWLTIGSVSQRATGAGYAAETITSADDDYVGSETCAACHDAQFKSFDGTKHGKLHTISSWKGKVVGCESCHGPGKAHVESSGDVTKIISFKRMDAKTASETCLACHAGKEN